MIVADHIEHLATLLKYVRVRWIANFEQLWLLLHKDAVVHERIAR